MIGRRGLLGAAGAVFVGCSCGTRPLLAADAPAAPRPVSIGGRRVPVCDVHAHCAFPSVNAALRGTPFDKPIAPPSLVVAQNRIAAMDARGIDVALLSVNIYWWYDADRDVAERVVRLQDEGLAELCRAYPGRFMAASSPAVQFPDLAAQQLEHAVRNLGARAASVGGHVKGEMLSSPRFDPFWAKVVELGVPVFMHPDGAQNLVPTRAWDGRGELNNVIGNPLETTMFLSRMIFDGTLDRFPGLKIIAAHGGGYLPSYLGRVEVACEVRPNAGCTNKRKPSEYLRDQIMADSMVFSEQGIRHLVAEMGPGQIIYGSDMPYVWPDTIDHLVRAQGMGDDDKRAILGGNFQRVLKMA
ncbi:amidohydrolase family protein [Roseomonas sp. BN140053]|uniref:amidohydrolase family protein n=1 Tax=Roseomonas sp. BN140053 TaxID=3391898 RepID=UPI0039E7A6DF